MPKRVFQANPHPPRFPQFGHQLYQGIPSYIFGGSVGKLPERRSETRLQCDSRLTASPHGPNFFPPPEIRAERQKPRINAIS